MTSSIVSHWRACIGNVYPLDREALSEAHGVFNLDYPPPAYVGDVERAPVILLNGSGGYDPLMTPGEFPDQSAIDRALDRLHNSSPVEPGEVSPYYAARNYADLIGSGALALVNAVPYRSPTITNAVRKVAKILPSTRVHVAWLQGEVLPAAQRGTRLVIAHRFKLWGLTTGQNLPGVHFTSAAISKDLPHTTLAEISRFRT
jgi:hypothetical protein